MDSSDRWEAWRKEQLLRDPSSGRSPDDRPPAPALATPRRAGAKGAKAERLGEDLAKSVRAVLDPMRARIDALEGEVKALRREIAIERAERRALASRAAGGDA